MSAPRFIERAPPAALRGFVDRLWLRWPGATDGRAGAGAGAGAQPDAPPVRVLPDGCIDVLVPLDGAPAQVVGVMTGALLVRPSATGQVAVRFRPGGAAPFLGVPASALTNLRVPLAELGSAFSVRLARAPASPRASPAWPAPMHVSPTPPPRCSRPRPPTSPRWRAAWAGVAST